MNIGKRIRLNRLFSHPSGRLCSVAIDHFIGYQEGLPQGLTNVPEAMAQIMKEKPDAMTMIKGLAMSAWEPYAGQVPLIISSIVFTADDALIERATTSAEAIRLGADAIAVAIGVRGPQEGKFLKILFDTVEEAAEFNLPVIAHIYPRDYANGARIVHDPENILWAVRCGIECGADVIKVPFTGDAESFREIVATSPVPVVAAGGPKAGNLYEALKMMEQVVASGANGATIGRNVWGFDDPAAALKAFKAVIHDGVGARSAMQAAGIKAP